MPVIPLMEYVGVRVRYGAIAPQKSVKNRHMLESKHWYHGITTIQAYKPIYTICGGTS